MDKVEWNRMDRPHQAQRVQQLRTAGVSVVLCSGGRYEDVYHRKGIRGRWHVTALIVDARVSFIGGANLTANPHVNGELVHHCTDVAGVAATEQAIRALREQLCPGAVVLSHGKS